MPLAYGELLGGHGSGAPVCGRSVRLSQEPIPVPGRSPQEFFALVRSIAMPSAILWMQGRPCQKKGCTIRFRLYDKSCDGTVSGDLPISRKPRRRSASPVGFHGGISVRTHWASLRGSPWTERATLSTIRCGFSARDGRVSSYVRGGPNPSQQARKSRTTKIGAWSCCLIDEVRRRAAIGGPRRCRALRARELRQLVPPRPQGLVETPRPAPPGLRELL